MFKLPIRFLILLVSIFVNSGLAFSQAAQGLDQRVNQLVSNPIALENGKRLFDQVCAACHGRDLTGGSGFNLTDGEWIHGSKPSQIVNNIKAGFMQAGMPGFAAVYSDQQIESIAAYVLSKRRGFEGLTYKIYQLKDKNDFQLDATKLIKKGTIQNNLADFRLPEVSEYVIEFEGTFYASKTEDTRIWVVWGFHPELQFESNGEVIERDVSFGEWYPTWKLKRGKQQLKITYHSGSTKPDGRNLTLIATNDDMSLKLFPVSQAAEQVMSEKKMELKVGNEPYVQRVKAFNLPTYSIAVGLPQQLNFAFNTKSCGIVGMWVGDFINVGPNSAGRGEDPSIPLGEWLFHQPEVIRIAAYNQSVAPLNQCRYLGYSLEGDQPKFKFSLAEDEPKRRESFKDNLHWALTLNATSPQTFELHLQPNDTSITAISLDLPKLSGIRWASKRGQISGTKAVLQASEDNTFTLIGSFN